MGSAQVGKCAALHGVCTALIQRLERNEGMTVCHGQDAQG